MKLVGLTSLVLGSAVFALGCSDPVPASPQGNFKGNINLTADRPSNANCQTLNFNPGLPGDSSLQPTTRSPGTKLVDGDDGARVACTVKKTGDTFSLQGRVAKGATSFYVSGDDIPGQEAAEGGATGSATVVIRSQGQDFESNLEEFGEDYNRSCDIKPLQIKSGAIWAEFTCDGIGSPPSNYCRLDNGVFVFEKCTD